MGEMSQEEINADLFDEVQRQRGEIRRLEQQNKRYEKIIHNIANIDAMFLNPDGTERDFSEKEALIAIERMVAPVWIEHCKKSWENNTSLQNK